MWGVLRVPCVCGWSGDWAEAGGWRGRVHEHGLGEAYGRRAGARCLYTPVCQVWSALLDQRAVRREPGGRKGRLTPVCMSSKHQAEVSRTGSTYLRTGVHEQGVSSHAGLSRCHAESRR